MAQKSTRWSQWFLRGVLAMVLLALTAFGAFQIYLLRSMAPLAGEDQLTGVALDAAGNVYVSGQTNSVDFPLANPLFSTYTPGPTITNWRSAA